MRKAKKPRRFVGKIVLTYDFLRVPDEGDARDLFDVRDAMAEACTRVLNEHKQAWRGSMETRVKPRPKGLRYDDEEQPVSSTPAGDTHD